MHLSSLPLRKCGLKYQNIFLSVYILYVTSLAEVWIEISFCNLARISQHVTSLAEVWIEMLVVVRTGTEDDGHFPCGSVDWNVQMNCLCRMEQVTSLAEVWIEIGRPLPWIVTVRSLPLRKCGLKYPLKSIGKMLLQSLPLRKCGLKSEDAVIETAEHRSLPLRKCGLKFLNRDSWLYSYQSLPLRKCGLKSTSLKSLLRLTWSLPLRKCGLKYVSHHGLLDHRRHFPCGSVDWNGLTAAGAYLDEVTSLAEVWIEIRSERGL